jgi:hypothetical protein
MTSSPIQNTAAYPLLKELSAAGYFGRKSGRGVFSY